MYHKLKFSYCLLKLVIMTCQNGCSHLSCQNGFSQPSISTNEDDSTSYLFVGGI